MKVKELIARLQTLPEESNVVITAASLGDGCNMFYNLDIVNSLTVGNPPETIVEIAATENLC